MERLTHRYTDGEAWASIYKVSACGENECKGPIIDRLAAYEDTGLMPEEIAELKAGRCLGCPVPAIIDEENHAHDLLKAEQDGRLVVMPFQIGDSIYRIATVKKYVKHLRHTSYIKRIVIKPGNVHKYINEIGKTVYFTREEAEAAMKDGDRG